MGFYDGTAAGDVILDDPQGQESPYRPIRAASGAEKIARIPPTVKPTRPTATTRETRSRPAGAGAAADLSLGRDDIRAQYTGKLDEETT